MTPDNNKTTPPEKDTIESTGESPVAIIRALGEETRHKIHVGIRSALAVLIVGTIIFSFFTTKIDIPGYFIGFAEAILAFYFFRKD